MGPITYGSVCSGIEAASVAWHPLGWRPRFFAEIDAFPSAVLAHRFPEVLNLGDFTTIDAAAGPIDVLVGGTPCQSFSVAGLRGGMDDARGALALEYLRLADRLRPRWMVWENVPGVLSSSGGRDFGSFLGGLVELGYGFAYRVLDAVHFGIPQRRRRVYVVGHLGDWRRAAAVLFEPSCMSRVSPALGQDAVEERDWWAGEGRVLNCIDAGYGDKWGSNQWYARGHVIIGLDGRPRRATVLEVERCLGFPDDYTDLSKEGPFASRQARAEHGQPLQHDGRGLARHDGPPEQYVRALWRRDEAAGRGSRPPDRAGTGHPMPPVQHQAAGRRGHGLGDAGVGLSGRPRRVADGPRYRALGNSMAVPVMRWIGERIDTMERIGTRLAA